MNSLTIALATAALLTVTAPAFANQSAYGNAISVQAEAGQLTLHGVWDSK